MAAAAILKIVFFGHNSSTDCLISAIFCTRKENSMSTRAKWQNLQIFEIQYGGRPPFRKSLNRHISVKNRPILVKFCTVYQMLMLILFKWPKTQFLKIQNGGGRSLENHFFGHNSSTDCPISDPHVTFGRLAVEHCWPVPGNSWYGLIVLTCLLVVIVYFVEGSRTFMVFQNLCESSIRCIISCIDSGIF